MICKKIKKVILVIILFFIMLPNYNMFSIAQETFELNTLLMKSTFKLAGNNTVGTCFILGKPIKEDPARGKFILITASHVLNNNTEDNMIIFLRKKYDSFYEKIEWEIPIRKNGKPLWIEHPEVDVSAMYVKLPTDIDINLLPINFLADDYIFNKYEIHPGDEMVCLGYPFGAESNKAGFPILRSGKIASYPIVPAKDTKNFLLDFEVFRGNSGGPVYFVQANRYYEGATHLGTIQFIAGLVSEEYSVTEEVVSLYESQKKIYPLSLAKIIHASFIKEVINMLPPVD